ncbi:hypothetical protein V8G54_019780 [Vigna mungo]|uniref:Uncharacterized protein n=1 Tax=Vigna mungo TaxID=3915 RepID=A0AAQ3NAR3_VIGMU
MCSYFAEIAYSGYAVLLNMLQLLCHPLPRLHISGLLLMQQPNIFGRQGILGSWLPVRYINNESVELKTDNDVVRFSLDKSDDINLTKKSQKKKKVKMSKKAKVNELRFYRLKAKKKMNSPNPEIRIRYKLEKVGFHCNFKF